MNRIFKLKHAHFSVESVDEAKDPWRVRDGSGGGGIHDCEAIGVTVDGHNDAVLACVF